MKKTLMVLFCLAALPISAEYDKGKDPAKRREWKMKRFKKHDTNNDGKWSKEEWMAKFTRMDTNKDGFISFEEKMANRKHKRHKK